MDKSKGFKYILDGLNAERVLIASECIGDRYGFVDRVAKYLKERNVFGQNQGVQFPIAEAYIEVEAANLMRWKDCELFDRHLPCGAEANMETSRRQGVTGGCNVGSGFSAEYDVERKFRKTRLYQLAPISTNLILSYVAEHTFGLPRSL